MSQPEVKTSNDYFKIFGQYKSDTYFGKYGMDIILTILILFILGLLFMYLKVQSNKNYYIHGKYTDEKGNQQSIIDNLAKLPLTDLKKDKNNPYYIRLAIQRKQELAANEKKTYVSPQKILQALKSISKNSNPRYREKVAQDGALLNG